MRESALEVFFRTQVRTRLRGIASKVAPVDKGMPDRLVLLPGGRLYLVELKTAAGTRSAAQRVWHERAALLGITVHTLAGKDDVLEWVQERLDRHDDEILPNAEAVKKTCRGFTPEDRGCRRYTTHATGLCGHHRKTMTEESA